MGAFDWLFGTREVAGQAQTEFVHPKIYGEVKEGPGVASLSEAAVGWQEVSAAFEAAATALDRVLRDSEVLMEGRAADQARESVTPLAQATAEAAEIAAATGKSIGQQADASSDFNFAFPEPHQVPPDNIGWGDYVNPYTFALKSGVRAGHEEVRDQVEAQARQQYEDYTRSTNERVNGIQQFSPPPKFVADVEPAKTNPVHKVEPIGTTSTRAEADQPAVPPLADPGPPPEPAVPDARPAVDAAPETPAESGSAWVAPAASGSPVTGGSVPVQTPGGTGGVTGGVVVPPGGRPVPPGTGRGGGTGTGRGAPPGTGRGGDTGKGLPGGGRSGSGGGSMPPAATGSGSPAARGASGGGVAGGPAAAGGRQKEEDKEHGRKFVKGDRDAWSDLEIPKVAPPVFGDWEAEALKGKPPRPPEQT